MPWELSWLCPKLAITPLYLDETTDTLTQFDMKDIESGGLQKFDFLGLKTLRY